jgi:hypothetical protein
MKTINGFKLVRSDRNDGRRGGGVGLYVKSGIAFNVVAKSTPEQPIDYIFGDLKIWAPGYFVAGHFVAGHFVAGHFVAYRKNL